MTSLPQQQSATIKLSSADPKGGSLSFYLTLRYYCFRPFRNLKQEQIQIRFNLVVAIAMAQIAFLSGIDALETKVSHAPWCKDISHLHGIRLKCPGNEDQRLWKIIWIKWSYFSILLPSPSPLRHLPPAIQYLQPTHPPPSTVHVLVILFLISALFYDMKFLNTSVGFESFHN